MAWEDKKDVEGCGRTPFCEVMERHWKRIRWNLTHLNSKEDNPYDDKEDRPAIKDISHSVVNIPVEYCKACPYNAGHFFFYTTLVLLVLAIVGWIV